MLRTSQDVKRKLEQRKRYVSNLIEEKKIISDGYELIFDMISKVEKGSKSHIVLLKIEEGLNLISQRTNEYLQCAKTSVLGLGKKHTNMLSGDNHGKN